MNWKIIIFILVFLILLTGYFSVVTFFYPSMENRGLFGDMFGGLNALFAGLAFLGVIYAIFLQKEELGLQRKELELTRKELKRTAVAQERSEQALLKQAASLKVTAQLNGKSAILQHYNTLIQMTHSEKWGISNPNEYKIRKESADALIQDIKKLIEDK